MKKENKTANAAGKRTARRLSKERSGKGLVIIISKSKPKKKKRKRGRKRK